MNHPIIFEKEAFSVPVVVTFYLTSNCNLSCSYCYEKGKTGVSVLSFERISECIDALSESALPIEAIFLFGGEPSLYPEQCIFLLNAVKQTPSLKATRVILFTNGIAVPNALWQRVLDGTLEVFLSFDGFGEASRLRFGSKLQTCQSIIEDDLKKMLSVAQNITVSVAIGKHNVRTIVSDISVLYNKYSVSRFKINLIRNELFSAHPAEITATRNAALEWAEQRSVELLWDDVDEYGSKYDNIYISETGVSIQPAGQLGTWEKVSW